MGQKGDYGIFVCPICNEVGQIERGVLVPQQCNTSEKEMIHKKCETSAYKFLAVAPLEV